MTTGYYKKMQSKVEEEIYVHKTQARHPAAEFDENILGYDVTKEVLSEEVYFPSLPLTLTF
jgi:hypothetical protein